MPLKRPKIGAANDKVKRTLSVAIIYEQFLMTAGDTESVYIILTGIFIYG